MKMVYPTSFGYGTTRGVECPHGQGQFSSSVLKSERGLGRRLDVSLSGGGLTSLDC